MTNPPPPGTPYPTTGSPRSAGAGNPAGRIALIFAIVVVAFEIVQQLVSVLIPFILSSANLSYSSVGAVFAVFGVIRILLSTGALAFGWFGATRAGLPQLTSGIGLGIGAAGVITGIFGLVSGPIAGLLI